jgi:hypothetical protein
MAFVKLSVSVPAFNEEKRITRDTAHVTSGRKFSLYSKREWMDVFWRFLTAPRKSARQRLNLHYDGRR